MRQSISLKSFIGTSRSSWQKSSYAWHAVLSHSFLDDYVSVEAGNVHWDKDCVLRQFSSLNDSYEVCCIFQIRFLFLCYRLYEEAVNKARFSFCGAAYHHVEVASQDLVLKDNKINMKVSWPRHPQILGNSFAFILHLTQWILSIEVCYGFWSKFILVLRFSNIISYGFAISNLFQSSLLLVIETLALVQQHL